MPYDVKEERRADSLMRGARVLLRQSGEPLVVQVAERKIKYTYLTFGTSLDGETVLDRSRYANEDKLTTLREKLTDVERFDSDLKSALRWAFNALAEGLARVPADELLSYAKAWHDGVYKGHVLDWSNGVSFFKTQAKFNMWQTVKRTFERLRELYGDSEITPLSAIVVELDHRDRERLMYQPNDPTSRSTNVISNLIDDLDKWSWETLADHARYQLPSEVREHEMTRLNKLVEARDAAVEVAEEQV